MSKITDGVLFLRHDGMRYFLQLFDLDVVAYSPEGLGYQQAKLWAHAEVAARWRMKEGTGHEANAYNLCDGTADAGGSWHYDRDRGAWVITENGHIVHSAPHIRADDYDTALDWAETIAKAGRVRAGRE
jgi:hypothetical protein